MFVCLVEGQFERIALFFVFFFKSYLSYQHLILYLSKQLKQTTMKITKIYHGYKDQCRCGCNGTYHKEGDKDFLYWVGEFNRLASEKPLTYEGETVKTKIEEVECSDILGTVLCAYREKDHSNSFMNKLTLLKQ